MGETKPWAIGIVVLCTIFTAIGSFLLKTGMDRFTPTWDGVLAAYPVLIGLFVYFIGFVMLTTAFRHGELSVLFPFVSLSFVWVAILSYLLLGEHISAMGIGGLGAIVCGVALIGIASRQKRKLRLKH
ncbi:DMT family transporter [Candidatus Woesearchaeota archaeon]|nr:DMT family transporter [Candidatus Woesearchaeota archaeon]